MTTEKKLAEQFTVKETCEFDGNTISLWVSKVSDWAVTVQQVTGKRYKTSTKVSTWLVVTSGAKIETALRWWSKKKSFHGIA